jgi:hypothetical protein
MRKFFAIVLITLGVGVGGCAQLQQTGNLLTAATKSYENPVTKQELYQIEASLRIVTEALVTYRRQCAKGTVDKNCWANIEAIQPYTRQVKPLLIELRSFVKTDDRVNGIVVYKRLSNLYNTIITEAAKNGVNLGV